MTEPSPIHQQPIDPRRRIRVPERERSLSTVVHEALETMVLEGVLEAGSKINIEALARAMEVSPTPVRESLARLEATGLVRSSQRSYRVAPILTKAEFDSLYDIRLLLEPWAAAQAAGNGGEVDRTRLSEELADIQGEAPPGSDWQEYARVAAHDARFHDLVADLSRNTWLRDSLRRMNIHLHLVRLYYQGSMGTQALEEHARICDAINARDPKAAERAMRQHLTSSRKRLSTAFE